MRMTGDAEVAADLTAETFAAALVGRGSYDPERGAPATWLYGSAAHKLNDWRRRGSAENRARVRLAIRRLSAGSGAAVVHHGVRSGVAAAAVIRSAPGTCWRCLPSTCGVSGLPNVCRA